MLPLLFQTVQPYNHHTNIPELEDRIHVYSFALEPEKNQPTGTCNFSRINRAMLLLDGNDSNSVVDVWATNFNILKIIGGMGGIAYSN